MQKTLLVCILLGLCWQASAANMLPKNPPKALKCQKALQTQLKKSFGKKTPEWEQNVDADFETQVFRAPVETGEWYELRWASKKTPQLFFYSSAKTGEYSWDSKCKLKETQGPGMEFLKTPQDAGTSFTDADLKRLLQEKKQGVIYLWSPRMTYSVTEFNRFRKVIAEKNIEFIAVLDHNADVREAKDALQKAGVEIPLRTSSTGREPSSVHLFRQMNSVELYMRNSNLHYPTMYVFKNGQMNPRRIVGVLTDQDIGKAVDEWMGDLK